MNTLPDSTAAKVAGMEALIAMAQEMPRHREEAGLGPLPDDAVALVYEERENTQL
jgi:hypothetical protein